MVRISRSFTLVGGLCALLSATAAFGQSATPATGLGQSWPNATDVSASSHYHVYAFQKDGIRYFQINDVNGDVLAAIAVANGVVLALPIGFDAADVTHSAAPLSGGALETIYSDEEITLTAAPKQNGHTIINGASHAAAEETTCQGQDCTVSNVSTGH